MELIYILAGIAAAFAFVWWLIVWTDRRDMRAAIRETNAQFLMEGKPIPEWARSFGPGQPVCERCPGPGRRHSCRWCADANGVIDCDGTSPCSTCPNKRECGKAGCIRIAQRRSATRADAASAGNAGVRSTSKVSDQTRNNTEN